MSSTDQPVLGSPQTNSSPDDEGGEPAVSENGDLPGVEQRVGEFVAEFPHLVDLPLSTVEGRELREAVVEEHFETSWWTDDDGERRSEEFFDERRALSWVDAVRAILEWNEEARGRRLRMGKGRPNTSEYESFTTNAEHSFHPEYAEREYAQLKALARETCGGEYPDAGEREGAFEDPHILFLSLTASSSPYGAQAPPVDHDRQVIDTWSGNDGVYRELWNVFRSLGVDGDSWLYHRQGEPHPGEGPAACYRHDHALIIFDAAAVDGDVDASDFHSVIETHVEKCDWAGWEAHDVHADDPEDRPLVLEEVGEDGIGDVAGYMAKYVSWGSEDLVEREIEYVAWAAIQWATNSQKYTRSDSANAAITADACRQRAADPEHDQVRGHAEDVSRADETARHDVECRVCGSSWEIDQDTTMTELRLEGDDVDVDVDVDVDEERRDLACRWRSARAAARVDDEGVVAFERPPRWRLEAVVDPDGEEHSPSPGGPTMLPLRIKDGSLSWWVSTGSKPPPDGMSQKARREAVLEACADGTTREEIVEAVEADAGDLEADVDRLLRDGHIYEAGAGILRRT